MRAQSSVPVLKWKNGGKERKDKIKATANPAEQTLGHR